MDDRFLVAAKPTDAGGRDNELFMLPRAHDDQVGLGVLSRRPIMLDACPDWRRDLRRSKWIARLMWCGIPGGAAALAIYVTGVTAAGSAHAPVVKRSVSLPPVAVQQITPVADVNLLKPLTQEEAEEQNASKPFSTLPDTAAQSFLFTASADDRALAAKCLTEAVYYEAAGEGEDGGRAVAQVVLNRLRHPSYPANVCAVIYEGSSRATGCQFTFTCDGSLQRRPVPNLWTRAVRIASEALAGRVFAPVGHATHYHADYVVPYWADSLEKRVQIGRHIFYRFPGVMGQSRSFFGRYIGPELRLAPSEATAAAAEGSEGADGVPALLSDLTPGLAETPPKAAPANPVLFADAARGTLIAGEALSEGAKAKQQSAEPCGTGAAIRRVERLSAVDLRANSASRGDCG